MRSGGGRPARGYRLADGTKVPSVTTITGRFKESGGLIQWAYKMGLDGKDMNRERDHAGNAGSLAHDLIEGDILGKEPVLPTAESFQMTQDEYDRALTRARMAFGGFRSWRRSVNVEIVATELPLVSELYKFGGTIDAVGRVSGGHAIIDWKSSNKIYSDYVIQVSAYRGLWDENHPDEPVRAVHLLRVGKDYGDFHHHFFPMDVIAPAWRAFLLQRELYDIDAALKKVAA